MAVTKEIAMREMAIQPLPDDHPLVVAWEAYRGTPEAANAQQWAATLDVSEPMQGQIIVGHPHLVGALWAAFRAGYAAANSQPQT